MLSVVIEKKQYVWAQELSAQAITKRTAKKNAEKIVGVVFLVLTALSLFWFLVFFLFFESTPLFVLFLSLLFLMFTISHLVQISSVKQTIPKRELGAEKPAVQVVQEGGEKIDVAELFDSATVVIIDQAFSLAKQFGHAQVESLHLFIASLSDDHAAAVLGRLQIKFEKIKEPLGRRLGSRQIGKEIVLSEPAERVFLSAFANAYEQGRQVVNAFEIFFEAFLSDEFIQEVFFDQGVTKAQFTNMVAWVRIHEKMREQYETFRRAAQFKPTGAMNRSMTAIATPTLDAYSEDLTTAAVQGRTSLLVDRETELEEVFRVIEGGRQSAVLVGPEGVGKASMLAGIAALMVEERVPKILQDKRLVRISIPHLLSGAEPQEAQERLMQVLYEAVRSGNIILAFSDLEQMTNELSTVLVDFLSRGGTFAIATTTPQGYTSTIERSILGRVFEKVNVGEPGIDEAIRILESKILGIEYDHKVSFSYIALETIVQLSDRFMHESYLPKKAIEIAKEVAVMIAKERGADALVGKEDVSRLISEKTGVPTTQVGEEEKDTLLHLEERMHGRVVGQEEAVTAVAAALRRARTQLRSENRPIATFLFLGPTGVGKTELAKTVAESYFGSENSMIRLDMSEYQQPESLSRLIGRPGSNEGGLLSEAVRQQPFALILLDEFEKADPGILNLFLQVFDDGRLTDAAGRTIDFTNTIIITTTNAEKEFYRPELLNRFDGVIVFKPLTQNEIVQITNRLIAKVAERLEAKGIHFRASDDVIISLAHKGYDPVFGARPLRRLVQEEVDNAIASALLKDDVKRRDTIVLERSGIRIEKATAL